jgi:xylulokinase
MLESQKEKIKVAQTIRFAGGGALSAITGQILADITGHRIDVVENPQNVGSVGAAAVIGVGLGIIPGFEAIKEYILPKQSFIPDEKSKAVYERNFKVFKRLYKSNKDSFKAMHQKD